jgi:hypothetical protein
MVSLNRVQYASLDADVCVTSQYNTITSMNVHTVQKSSVSDTDNTLPSPISYKLGFKIVFPCKELLVSSTKMNAVVSWVRNIIALCSSLLLAIWHREVGWPTIDRRTRRFKREQQPLLKKFKLLVLFNAITEWIDTTHLVRLWTHEKSLSAGMSPFGNAADFSAKSHFPNLHRSRRKEPKVTTRDS